MSVHVESYRPETFHSLHELDAAAQAFMPYQDAALAQLRQVINANGLDDIVGIQLLHKHFDLGMKELLVESVIAKYSDGDTYSVTKPETIVPDTQILVPYIFKHGSCDSIVPLEFTGRSEYYAGALARLSNAAPFVEAFSKAVKNLKLCDVVGLSILPPSDVCNMDEWMVEEPGVGVLRELVLKTFKRGAGLPDKADFREVLWTAGAPRERGCRKVCRSDPMSNVERHIKMH